MTTWINNLKIAIIEKDIGRIASIIKELPEFKNLDRAKEALSLIGLAIEIVDNEKQKTLKTMKKIKQTKEFLSLST